MAEMMRAMMGGMLILVLPAFLIFLGVAVITYRRRVGPGSGEAGGDGWDGGRGGGPAPAPGAPAGPVAVQAPRGGRSWRGRGAGGRGSGAASTGLRKSRI